MRRLMPDRPLPSRARLLIVEDDAAIRSAFRQALGGTHEVATAGSCAEAERLMAERPAELLLLDYALPDGTGLGLLARLARTWPDVRALLVSGDLEAAARDPDGARCPPVRRLAKPVSVAALRTAVDEVLGTRPPA
jgi:DNA-binding NtrC family response regulator